MPSTGETCQVAGIYRVINHIRHPKEITMPKGHQFPPCSDCIGGLHKYCASPTHDMYVLLWTSSWSTLHARRQYGLQLSWEPISVHDLLFVVWVHVTIRNDWLRCGQETTEPVRIGSCL